MKELYSKTSNEKAKNLLFLRSQMSKTSVSKYKKMLDILCNDSRIRGVTQFYGASRTGRWAGRFVQLQNLPQNHISDLALAREVVKFGDYELFKILYDQIPNVLSDL